MVVPTRKLPLPWEKANGYVGPPRAARQRDVDQTVAVEVAGQLHDAGCAAQAAKLPMKWFVIWNRPSPRENATGRVFQPGSPGERDVGAGRERGKTAD